jgi:hypothetical protein
MPTPPMTTTNANANDVAHHCHVTSDHQPTPTLMMQHHHHITTSQP